MRRTRSWLLPLPRPEYRGPLAANGNTPAGWALVQERRWRVDKWCYDLGDRCGEHQSGRPPRVVVAAEGIKFAYNAWQLVRTCAFFGAARPAVLRSVADTTPTMDIAVRGNRLFHMNCDTAVGHPSTDRVTIALTPAGTDVVPLEGFDFERALRVADPAKAANVIQIVVGHENGLSAEVAARCDYRVRLAQYGSVGSFSLNNALGIAVARATAVLNAADTNPALPSRVYEQRSQDDAKDRVVNVVDLQTALSSDPYSQSGAKAVRPHADAFLGLEDAAVAAALAGARARMPLQVAVVFENITADRNIAASMRSANAYNCAPFIVLGRRKFSRRGGLGTENYTPTIMAKSWDRDVAPALKRFEL